MKTNNRVTLALAALLAAMLLPACAGGVSQAEIQAQLDTAQLEIDALTGSLDRLQRSELENPSWAELEAFLNLDDTDTIPYVERSFDCSGFAITLRDRAWRYGLRSAYVEIGFSAGEGHALNAFDTSDKGLIYIDATEADRVAYVEIGESYGGILLDAVKSEYIAGDGEPADFWRPLTYASHPDPFAYSYYEDYQRRLGFYADTVDAYNDAVDDYNNGRGKRTLSQLNDWRDNILALEEDLGGDYLAPGDAVESVEAYWD